jgi:uncharacterized protein (TIGR02466 family)
MFIQAMFPTPVVTFQIDPELVSLAALREVILAREEMTQGVTRSNIDGWQSPDDFLAWCGPDGTNLVRQFGDAVEKLSATFDGHNLKRGGLNWHVQAWANINRQSHANATHFHPGSYWSGCFYVDDGGIAGAPDLGGALEFTDPRGPLPIMYAPHVKIAIDQCATAGLGERIHPRMGTGILFPSWLSHAVTPYWGNGTRISIALNFCLPH